MGEQLSAISNRKNDRRRIRRIRILKSSLIGGAFGAAALPMVMIVGRLDSGPNYTTIFVGLMLALPADLLCRMFGSSMYSSNSNDPNIINVFLILAIATDAFLGMVIGAVLSCVVGFVRMLASSDSHAVGVRKAE
jgi:hypothetical protein